MERGDFCGEPVALLRRGDGEFYKIYCGADWQAQAEALSVGHCFDVHPILVAPGAPAGVQQHISAALKQSSIGSDWFVVAQAALLVLSLRL